MRPIILSTSVRDSDERRDVFVNPERVSYFKATPDNDETYVYFQSDLILRVHESPEQIMRRLEDNRVSLRAEDRDGMRALA